MILDLQGGSSGIGPGLGWVDFVFVVSLSAQFCFGKWAYGGIVVAARPYHMVEHSNSCQPNLGLRPVETPCRFKRSDH